MSESNRVSLKYVAETTYGTTPADSPNWQALRFEKESLGGTPKTTVSNEIRDDRMISDMPKVGLEAGGEIGIELSATSYDDFIEAALCGTWTTNVLEVGTVDRSFSIEKVYEDLTGNNIVLLTGQRVAQFNLNREYGNPITGSFLFAGNGITLPASSAVGTGSVAAKTTNPVINAAGDVTLLEYNNAGGIYFKKFDVQINNNMRPTEAIGYDAPINQRKGESTITISTELYFESIAQYQDVINNASVRLEITDSDGTNSYAWLFPACKPTSPPPSAEGKNQDIMHRMEFTALYDATEGTAARVTRV